MKNNYLHKIEKQPFSILLNSKHQSGMIGLMLGLFTCHNVQAQLVNETDVKLNNDAVMAVHMDYENAPLGNFINDGQLYIFQNWKNDGIVTYSDSKNGTTFFIGSEDQFIEANQLSNFKNIIFKNVSSLVPFHLGGKIAIGGNSAFDKGVIQAGDYGGLVIFKDKGTHTLTSDLSFVDGQVQKIGGGSFEFPIGAGKYFRPAYQDAGNNAGDIYTTQYFNKNSNAIYSHEKRDEKLEIMDQSEYWEVKQDKGADKIVLSLTLDNRTTPAEFFNSQEEYEVVIARWDPTADKWVNEGGEVSDPLAGKPYEKLLTSVVSGYGIFTAALVKKAPPIPEEVVVYNAISPNDDGLNDSFLIEGISNFPDNHIEIYNRWGVRVYDADSYNESDKMFRGYSDGRSTVKRGDKLPTGTYFYILKYNTGKRTIERKGYLYINNQ
ncbi:gliding motility-associated C-terminal domain-containing protein [Flavobacterium sp. KACC 22761]|uniref:gliding motility-associated C-terminal domain-containing protein n=1 Tax=Flavobacterium sp. KACC 22761 TaxID=3092665 RepID=UPI002A764662|nr:gliding motility-associated C-terminal domain-containing protein [Flavobacterium sp. KACC 22761]WPO78476.1 gliding motility-associated C-terminal domain-containing protein [Flavobacterium sp. KACC 22761]